MPRKRIEKTDVRPDHDEPPEAAGRGPAEGERLRARAGTAAERLEDDVARARRGELPAPAAGETSPDETSRLLHELRAHQVELEMQNEELRETQQRLEASRERYYDLYDRAPVGYLTLSDGGTIVDANITASRQLDCEPSELVGKSFTEFVVAADQDVYHHWRRTLCATGTPQHCEVRLAPLREPRWIQIDGSLWRDPAGGPPLLRATLTDAGALKRAEADLRRLEATAAVLSQSSPDFLYALDHEQRYIAANEAYCRALGLTAERLVGKTNEQVDGYPGPLAAERRALHDWVLEHDAGLEIVSTVAPPGAAEGPYGVVLTPIAGADGTVTGVHGHEHRIADRRVVLSSERGAEELARFFSLDLDPLCIADTSGRFLRVNKAWTRVLGYTPEELEGTRFLDLVHPDDLEATLAAIGDLEQDKEVRGFVNRYRHKDGSYRSIEWRSSPDAGGRIYAAARDVTERLRVDARAARLTRAQEMLTAVTEAAAQSADEHDLLTRVCAVITAVGGHRLAWIGYTGHGPGPGDIRVMAWAGEPEGYADGRDIALSLRHGKSTPAAGAVLLGEPVVVRDPADTDKYDKAWRDTWRAAGFTSGMALPLEGNGETIGVVVVWDSSDDAFQDEEERVLFRRLEGSLQQGIARLRETAARGAAEAAVERQRAVLAAVNGLLRDALSVTSEQELAARGLSAALEITGSAFGIVGELGAAGKLDILAISDPVWEACRMPRKVAAKAIRGMQVRGLWSHSVLTGESQIVNEPESHPDRAGTPAGHPAIDRLLTVAVRQSGAVRGVIALANKETPYDPGDREDVESLASALSEALARVHAEHDLRQSHEAYRTIFDSAPVMVWQKDTGSTFLHVNPAACAAVGMQAGDIQGKSAGELFPTEAENYEREDLEVIRSGKPRLGTVERLPGRDGESLCVQTDRFPWWTEDGEIGGVLAFSTDITGRLEDQVDLQMAEDRYRLLVEHLNEVVFTLDEEGILTYVSPQTKEMLGVSPEDLVGTSFFETVHLDDRELAARCFRHALKGKLQPTYLRTGDAADKVRHWSVTATATRGLLGEAVIVASIQDVGALVRAEARRQKAEKQREKSLAILEHTVLSAAGTLARVVEVQDPYTAGHQERVAELANAIAERAGLRPRLRESLRLAALIHDLGKIAVPPQVLAKPGDLSNGEWSLIRQHSETGYEIVKDMQFPGPVARIIREHHERWDGSGYARGLRGERIHAASRILAVADVVEAMSAHRPYRPALGIDAALAEIEAGAGKRYDEAAVHACVRLFREDGFQFSDPSWSL